MSKIKKFSDFNDGEDLFFSGEKIKIDDVTGKEIIIKSFKVEKSKYGEDKKVLTIQYVLNGETYISFTGSSVLIDQLEKYKQELPFSATIEKVNRFYTLT